MPSAAMPLAVERRKSCHVYGTIGTPPFNSAMRASSLALRRLSPLIGRRPALPLKTKALPAKRGSAASR